MVSKFKMFDLLMISNLKIKFNIKQIIFNLFFFPSNTNGFRMKFRMILNKKRFFLFLNFTPSETQTHTQERSSLKKGITTSQRDKVS